jgi:hypothetical protein
MRSPKKAGPMDWIFAFIAIPACLLFIYLGTFVFISDLSRGNILVRLGHALIFWSVAYMLFGICVRAVKTLRY